MKYLIFFVILCISVFFTTCTSFNQPSYLLKDGDLRPKYFEQIIQWQRHLQFDQQWNEHFIRQVIRTTALFSKYKGDGDGPSQDVLDSIETDQSQPDIPDEWMTPREFWEAKMQGDCEDFTSFQWFILAKVLKCPYEVRICAVTEGGLVDHAVLRIHLPSGWKIFQTMPGVGDLDTPFYTPIVEWDDKHIYTFH